MISQVTFNKEKWISAMMLDPITGLDPPGAKIRAAEGIDAASNFIQGYWLWWVCQVILLYFYITGEWLNKSSWAGQKL